MKVAQRDELGRKIQALSDHARPQSLARRARAGLPGFEPGFEAPEAAVLSRLYYRPVHY